MILNVILVHFLGECLLYALGISFAFFKPAYAYFLTLLFFSFLKKGK